MLIITVGSDKFNVPGTIENPDFSVFPQSVQPSLQEAFDNGDYTYREDTAPNPPARSIDMRRLRLALLEMDLLDSIDAAISAQSRSAQIEWEFATNVQSDHPLVIQVATAMSLNVNQIFDLAETFT